MDEMTYLNIGCGLKAPKNWINIDASPSLLISKLTVCRLLLGKRLPAWPHNVQYGNIVSGVDIQRNGCDLIFASHVLEHLSLDDAHIALANIYSILKPGGILRLIVPDLFTITHQYVDRVNTINDPKAAFKFLDDLGVGFRMQRTSILARLINAFSNSQHQWMWDELSLKQALASAGFRDIMKRRYGDWADNHFEEVEEEGRHYNSICVEAKK
jgi:predicted SAM-dependent methyltransferase